MCFSSSEYDEGQDKTCEAQIAMMDYTMILEISLKKLTNTTVYSVRIY